MVNKNPSVTLGGVNKTKYISCILTIILMVVHDTSLNTATSHWNFVEVIEKNMPSVVVIRVDKKKKKNVSNSITPKVSKNSNLKNFFEKNFSVFSKYKKFSATGAGVILSSDGIIATASHLVKNAKNIDVWVDGVGKLNGTLVKMYEEMDIAIIRVKKNKLVVPAFGSSISLKLGQPLLAIGVPFGRDKSIAQGVLSSKGRKISKINPTEYLQTDISINPGGSGGPLINEKGEVVGLNSSIYTSTGSYQGVSFAIPIEKVLEIYRIGF